jgi:2-methylcitrate dehydratase
VPGKLPQTYQIARFALSRKFSDLDASTIDQLKKHLLDAMGSLFHCINRPTIQKLASYVKEVSAGGSFELPAIGKTNMDKAALFYTALIRYPDFMDNYLGKEATCHPSDNIGPLLAASLVKNFSGEEFLISMAIGYELECRLIEEIPVMIKGFDHTLLLAYSITAAICNLWQLPEPVTANALSIAGSSFNPLVTSRAAYTSEWKGLQSAMVVSGCLDIVLMAKEGITGPIEIFEGPKGFEKEFGMKLDYDWNEDHFDLIPHCILKLYNAEVHTQSLVEAALELKHQHHIDPLSIIKIEVITFLTAYHIVGGGEYGDRKNVHTKEQADHSLPYVIAASLLDDELYPEQLLEERINRNDVQDLLQKVEVQTKFPLHKPVKVAGVLDAYTKAYPGKLMGEVKIHLENGKVYSLEKQDYYGFHTRPLSWQDVEKKFKRLSAASIDKDLQNEVIDIIKYLEHHQISDLLDRINRMQAS